MAKYEKYRSQQELMEAQPGAGYDVIVTIENVTEEIKDVRKRINKLKEVMVIDGWKTTVKDVVDYDLRSWLVLLNKVVKQLKRNKKRN